MAVNLVGMVMQYLTPDRIGRIAAAFNLDSKSAQSVAEVSVPSLLAGLASLAVQPGGAQSRQSSGKFLRNWLISLCRLSTRCLIRS
jgi:Bacterial protein of unknown function (DUF937)